MIFQAACHTDSGPVRPSNQDSCCIKAARLGGKQAALVLVCDGLGGLIQGELASAQVVRAFDNWFWNYLPPLLEEGLTADRLSSQWNGLIQGENRALRDYGARNGISLGTTVTALLVVERQYFLLHAGDSRAYLLWNGQAVQLTSDQTLAAREYRAGRITAEQLRSDPRQHVLLQCVGVDQVTPDFLSGQVPDSCVFLLCSDGFYHTLLVTGAGPEGRLVAAHSDDALDRPLRSYDYRQLRAIHIEGFRAPSPPPPPAFEALYNARRLP